MFQTSTSTTLNLASASTPSWFAFAILCSSLPVVRLSFLRICHDVHDKNKEPDGLLIFSSIQWKSHIQLDQTRTFQAFGDLQGSPGTRRPAGHHHHEELGGAAVHVDNLQWIPEEAHGDQRGYRLEQCHWCRGHNWCCCSVTQQSLLQWPLRLSAADQAAKPRWTSLVAIIKILALLNKKNP